jgi:hypothetical protein
MSWLRRSGSIVFAGTVSVVALVPSVAQAAKSCVNSNGLTTYCKLDPQDGLGIPSASLGDRVSQIVSTLGLIAGVLAVLFIVIGGINYATSEGDSKRLASAKQTISYAIAGLVISIIAPLIVGFVIAKGPQ